jgi:serine/threonine protein kinase
MDVKELIGVTLGNCTLERLIGRGGMGAVFLAQQSRPIRIVAVKALLLPEGIDEHDRQTFLERFRREADTAAKLEHKNILPVFEYAGAEVNGQQIAYLVMPYIRGGTLRERIDEMNREGRRFNVRLIADYIDQVAGALDYAHGLGVIHRDVKPANLLFHDDGRLLLSDFGIARLSDLPSLTTAGNFLGTAEYASPEQANTGSLNARSDIYSLGIVLYELLTGHVPFTASNPYAVLAKHINLPVPSIRSERPDLSPALEFVVKKALAKQPADRYQTAQEMAEDLRAAISPVSPAQGHGMLRLTGDANNNDLTVAGDPWSPPAPPLVSPFGPARLSPLSSANPVPSAVPAAPAAPVLQRPNSPAQAQQAVAASPIPPTSPAIPAMPVIPDSADQPIQRKVGGWPWHRPPQPSTDDVPGQQAGALSMTMQQWNRRWYYFATILFAALAQIPAIVLLLSSAPGNVSLAVLGVLAASCINLLALAAIEFTGVIRDRSIASPRYRCLAATLAALLVSGFFISFGAANHVHAIYIPLLAYAALLASNIYALRQLGSVDRAPEQVRPAPLAWRPALIGTLTGLLPLTMILILTLTAPATPTGYLLLRVLAALLVALIGAPTPGAVLAVQLSRTMTFPSFLRSSALAGMLMFAAAFVLVTAWITLTSGHMLLLDQFKLSALAFPIGLCILALLGALRAMLDVRLYWHFWGKSNPRS